MIIPWIVLLALFISSGFLFIKKNNRSEWILTWLGWMGCGLAIISFFFFSWINISPYKVFEQNIEWVVKQTAIIAPILENPAIKEVIGDMKTPTVHDIKNLFRRSYETRMMKISELNTLVNGWELLLLVINVKWEISICLAIGILSSIGIFIVNIHRLSTGRFSPMLLMKILVVISSASSFVLLINITTLDCLGRVDDFILRLFSSFMEIQVASGVWWFLLGLMFAAISSLGDWHVGFRPT